MFELLKTKLYFEMRRIGDPHIRCLASLRRFADMRLAKAKAEKGLWLCHSERELTQGPEADVVGVNQFRVGGKGGLSKNCSATRGDSSRDRDGNSLIIV